jgi:predicted nucleic acid-binding protein
MKYLLDTDTCIYALKQNAAVLRHLLANRRDDIAVSVITEAELRTGAIKRTNPSKNLQRVENFLQPLKLALLNSRRPMRLAMASAREARAVGYTHWPPGHRDCFAGCRSKTDPCHQQRS